MKLTTTIMTALALSIGGLTFAASYPMMASGALSADNEGFELRAGHISLIGPIEQADEAAAIVQKYAAKAQGGAPITAVYDANEDDFIIKNRQGAAAGRRELFTEYMDKIAGNRSVNQPAYGRIGGEVDDDDDRDTARTSGYQRSNGNN